MKPFLINQTPIKSAEVSVSWIVFVFVLKQVRVYTPKRIHQELETSKEDYIRINLSLRNQKVQLPKLVETFAKESGLCSTGLTEMVYRSIPESSRKCFKRCQSGSSKSRKAIDWIPHSFTFRYLILREAAK